MDKKVLCKFDGRSKKLAFTSSPTDSDLSNLQNAFLKAAERDEHLSKMLKDHDFVFQMYDKEMEAIVDVEEDDAIPDKSQLSVLFVLRNKLSKQTLNGTDEGTSLPPALEFDSLDEFTKQVIVNGRLGDPVDVDIIDSSVKDTDNKKPKSSTASSQADNEEESEGDSFPNEDLSDDSVVKDTVQSKVLSKKTLVPKGVQLPSTEGTRLEEFTSNSQVLQHLDEFTRAWATDLSRITKGHPLPSDYKNYAKSIVKKYPFLGKSTVKGTSSDLDETNHRAMAEKLSACLRRRRNYLKRLKEKGSKKIPHESSKTDPKKSKNKTEKQLKKTDKPSTSRSVGPETCEDVKSLLVELKKNSSLLKDIAHAKLLLAKTLEIRRNWIKDESSSCADVLQEVPAFKNMDLVLYEAELHGWYSEEKVRVNFEIIASQLAAYFESDDQAIHLDDLQKELQSKQAPAKMRPLFTVNKVFGDTNCLRSEKDESLRLVLFMDVREVRTAFVVGEALQWEVLNPSICKCLASLLASYYVFNRAYPDLYKNALLFLEVNFFGLDASEPFTPKLKRFIQKLNAAAIE